MRKKVCYLLLMLLLLMLTSCSSASQDTKQKSSQFFAPKIVAEQLIGGAHWTVTYLGTPLLSPDGKYLAFNEKTRGDYQLTIVDTFTGKEQSFPVGDVRTWSTDSRKLIYFAIDKTPPSKLTVLNLQQEGFQPVEITGVIASFTRGGLSIQLSAILSPSNEFLAVSNESHIYIADTTTGALSTAAIRHRAFQWLTEDIFSLAGQLYKIAKIGPSLTLEELPNSDSGNILAYTPDQSITVKGSPYALIVANYSLYLFDAQKVKSNNYLERLQPYQYGGLIGLDNATGQVLYAKQNGSDCYQLSMMKLATRAWKNEMNCKSISKLKGTAINMTEKFRRLYASQSVVNVPISEPDVEQLKLSRSRLSPDMKYFAVIIESDKHDCKTDILGGSQLCAFTENVVVGKTDGTETTIILKRPSKDWSLGDEEATDLWWTPNDELYIHLGTKLYVSKLSEG